MSNETKSYKTLIGCMSALVALPFVMIWRAYVATVLWAWFVVPQFGLAPLGILTFMGIGCLLMLFHGNAYKSDGRTDEEKVSDQYTSITIAFMVPAAALVMGWLVKLLQG